MKARLLGVSLAAALALAFGGSQTACSSASGAGGGGGGGGVNCASSDGSECLTLAEGLPCGSDHAMVASCPSTNQLGCCAIVATASDGTTMTTTTTCYYCQGSLSTAGEPASTLQTQCKGTGGKWTAGDVTTCAEGGTGSSGGDAAAD